MRLLTFLFFFFFVDSILAQGFKSNDQYQPIDSYFYSEEEIIEIKEKLLNVKNDSIIKTKKDLKNYKEILKKRINYLVWLSEDGQLLYKDSLTNKIQKLLNYIIDQNNINDKFKNIYIKRSDFVNASSFGGGYIIVNFGLLDRVETIDELAFVVCHELAHDIDAHYEKHTIYEYLNKYDNDFNKKLKKANKKKYGSYYESKNVLVSSLTKEMKYSQGHEFIADSLGLIFYLNAGFDKNAINKTLNMLKESDVQFWKDSINFYSIFNSSTYQLDSSLLKTDEQYSFWEENSFLIPDSLRTHPNIDKRISRAFALAKDQNIPSKGNKLIDLQADFEGLKSVIRFESLYSLILTNDISQALYRALVFKTKNINNKFVDAVIVYALFETSLAIRDRTFLDVVPFPSEKFNYQYNLVLNFLHNLNSNKALLLSTDYYKNNLKSDLIINAPFYDYLQISIKEEGYSVKKKIIEAYKEKWGESYTFTKKLENRLKD